MPLFGPPNTKKMEENGNVKGLIKALEYRKQHHVPLRAARALGRLQAQEAVEPLIAMLKSGDKDRMERAADALGDIGDRGAFYPLLTALEDDEWEVRRAAARALGKLGDERAVRGLSKMVTDKYTSAAACEALGKIGTAEGVEPLLVAYSHPQPTWSILHIVHEALLAIGERGVEPLLKATYAPDPDVQAEARQVLDEIGYAADEAEKLRALFPDIDWSTVETIDEGVLDQLFDNVLGDSDPTMRQGLQQIVSTTGWEPDRDPRSAFYYAAMHEWEACTELGEPAITPLMAVLERSSSLETKLEVVEALCRVAAGHPQALVRIKESGLIETLARRREPPARQMLYAIGRSAVELEEQLETADSPVQMDPVTEGVIRELAQMGRERALRARLPVVIRTALQWQDQRAAKKAREELRGIDHPAVIDALADAYAAAKGIGDQERRARYKILGWLRARDDARAVPVFQRGIRDRDIDVCTEAARGLREQGKDPVPQLLRQLSSSSDPFFRRNAARALGKLGDERACVALRRALRDEAKMVRSFAQGALDDIQQQKNK